MLAIKTSEESWCNFSTFSTCSEVFETVWNHISDFVQYFFQSCENCFQQNFYWLWSVSPNFVSNKKAIKEITCDLFDSTKPIFNQNNTEVHQESKVLEDQISQTIQRADNNILTAKKGLEKICIAIEEDLNTVSDNNEKDLLIYLISEVHSILETTKKLHLITFSLLKTHQLINNQIKLGRVSHKQWGNSSEVFAQIFIKESEDSISMDEAISSLQKDGMTDCIEFSSLYEESRLDVAKDNLNHIQENFNNLNRLISNQPQNIIKRLINNLGVPRENLEKALQENQNIFFVKLIQYSNITLELLNILININNQLYYNIKIKKE
jgi:hypothetical protein